MIAKILIATDADNRVTPLKIYIGFQADKRAEADKLVFEKQSEVFNLNIKYNVNNCGIDDYESFVREVKAEE